MNRVNYDDAKKIKKELDFEKISVGDFLGNNYFYSSRLCLDSSSYQNNTNLSSKSNIELQMLLKKSKLYSRNLIDRVNWLDKITFSRLEEIKQEVF